MPANVRERLASGDGGKNGFFNSNYTPLNQIAQNTATTASNTAKALELKRFALGGGDLGQMGISPAEMYGSRQGTIQVDAGNAAAAIEKAIHQIASNVAVQMQRQRGPSGRLIQG